MSAPSTPAPLSGVPAAPATGLTERELAVLAFERQWWKYAGAKETAIKDLFDMSATRYYQVLNTLIDRPGGARRRPHARQAPAPPALDPAADPLRPPARPGRLRAR